MKITRNTWVLAAAFACAACSNADDESVQFASVSMNLVLGEGQEPVATDAGATDAGANNGPLRAREAIAFIRHIEFYLPKGDGHCDDGDGDGDAGPAVDAGSKCEGEEKIRVDGPWVVDLMTGETTPSMADIMIPAGSYRRIDVRFEDADKNARRGMAVPEKLKDWSLVASGDYGGETAKTFDMRLKFNNDARFQSRAGIELRADAPAQVTMMLDVQSWFDVVSLDECFRKERLAVVDDSLQIIDEKRRCNAIENAIKREMKHAGRFEKRARR